jgi:acyl dehydratase
MMDKFYFDDLTEDMVVEFGKFEMTQDEIIRFAKAYDPQPFHTEPVPPPGSGFPKLIASGWNSAAATMRMLVENWFVKCHVLPSPGVDELRFLQPVFPNDTLRVRLRVIAKRKSSSKPDRGIVNCRIETLNQHGDVVLSFKSIEFIKVRPD